MDGSAKHHLREEMRALVRAAALPRRAGESTKAAIARVARALKLDPGRAKRYWYGEVAHPLAAEVDRARSFAAARPNLAPPAMAPVIETHKPQIDILYDQRGRVWHLGDPALHEHLGLTTGDFDVATFATRNLGWANVRFHAARMHVRLNPSRLQSSARDALFDLLASAPPLPVTLTLRVGKEWEDRSLGAPIDALCAIEALSDRAAQPTQRFVSTRQPISVLFRDRQSALLRLVEEARNIGPGSTCTGAVRFAEADPTGRASVAVGNAISKSGRLAWSWEHVAKAIRYYTPSERRQLIGRDIRQAPDHEYGAWCADGYDRALAAREPVVEDIRALVIRKDADPIESRYRRVLVPVPGELPTLLVATQLLTPQRRAA